MNPAAMNHYFPRGMSMQYSTRDVYYVEWGHPGQHNISPWIWGESGPPEPAHPVTRTHRLAHSGTHSPDTQLKSSFSAGLPVDRSIPAARLTMVCRSSVCSR